MQTKSGLRLGFTLPQAFVDGPVDIAETVRIAQKAEALGFDDKAWADIATPHSFNDVDSFRKIISHSGGDTGTYKGLSWYRKHFKLPAEAAGSKVFIEFEIHIASRSAARLGQMLLDRLDHHTMILLLRQA